MSSSNYTLRFSSQGFVCLLYLSALVLKLCLHQSRIYMSVYTFFFLLFTLWELHKSWICYHHININCLHTFFFFKYRLYSQRYSRRRSANLLENPFETKFSVVLDPNSFPQNATNSIPLVNRKTNQELESIYIPWYNQGIP